jgi:hypothetical protein
LRIGILGVVPAIFVIPVTERCLMFVVAFRQERRRETGMAMSETYPVRVPVSALSTASGQEQSFEGEIR